MTPQFAGEVAYTLGETEDANPYDSSTQWAEWYNWLYGYAYAYSEATGRVFVSKHREFHKSRFA